MQISICDDDNSALLDALALGNGSLTGIAVVHPTIKDEELATLKASGVCGLRFVDVTGSDGRRRFPNAPSLEDAKRLSSRMREHGLYAEIWADAGQLCQSESLLRSLGVPLVLEHMAGASALRGADDPDFRRIVRIASDSDIWVKLAICRVSNEYPNFGNVRPLHDAFLNAMRHRLIWGSDWPHVRMGEDALDVGHLLDLLYDWIDGDNALWQAILVDNPARIFGFGLAPNSIDDSRHL